MNLAAASLGISRAKIVVKNLLLVATMTFNNAFGLEVPLLRPLRRGKSHHTQIAKTIAEHYGLEIGSLKAKLIEYASDGTQRFI
jgi:hypothetical protein